jgi:hypothetical protein
MRHNNCCQTFRVGVFVSSAWLGLLQTENNICIPVQSGTRLYISD